MWHWCLGCSLKTISICLWLPKCNPCLPLSISRYKCISSFIFKCVFGINSLNLWLNVSYSSESCRVIPLINYIGFSDSCGEGNCSTAASKIVLFKILLMFVFSFTFDKFAALFPAPSTKIFGSQLLIFMKTSLCVASLQDTTPSLK